MTNLEKISPEEQDFYNVVMLGSETMLPNSGTSIVLRGVETTRRTAHSIRKIGIAGLDIAAPMTVGMSYSSRSNMFVVDRIGVRTDRNNRPLMLDRTKDGFRSHTTQRPYADMGAIPSSEIEAAFYHLDLPQVPPQEDPEEYQNWLNNLRSYSKASSTKERSVIRKGRAGLISASLVAVRQQEQFPNLTSASTRGVEYSITDRTDPDVMTKQISFVGEHKDSGIDEFSAYEERIKRFKNGQMRRSPRSQITLTALIREKWLERLIDEDTGVPHLPQHLD